MKGIFEPFRAKISKAKIDLLKGYIDEYSDGWKEIMGGEKEQEEQALDMTSLDDVDLLKQQKNMISKLLNKVTSESARVRLELKQFFVELAKILIYVNYEKPKGNEKKSFKNEDIWKTVMNHPLVKECVNLAYEKFGHFFEL